MPCLSSVCSKLMGSRAAAPKGTMTYVFTHRGNFSSSFSSVCPLPPRLKSQPPGPNPSLKAQIPASRPKSQPWGSNSNLEAQIPVSRLKSQPQGSNPCLYAQIPASRPQFQPPGSNKNSIGHRLLRGRCPSHHLTPSYTHLGATGTADHLTLLRLFFFQPTDQPTDQQTNRLKKRGMRFLLRSTQLKICWNGAVQRKNVIELTFLKKVTQIA